jgi:(1->4)-alpha-D-glucan 1-alpha-D-glucosylmutase
LRVPTATYRVQFHANFKFADAENLIPYLHDLGVSHLYSSPSVRARRGSQHGYDVADPLRISAELGTEQEVDRLVAQLHRHGMSLLLDIVPNHMAASPENRWWVDVLENGRESDYASFFDIDWAAPGSKSPEVQKNHIVLPILTNLYDQVLTDQRIALRLDEDGFYFQAEANRVPISPKTYAPILETAIDFLADSASAGESAIGQVQRILAQVRVLAPEATAARSQIKHDLWHVYLAEQPVRVALDETMHAFNGTKGDAASFTKLDSLISMQAYRLSYWRTSTEEVNYRRFFGLNDLVALREEDPKVFESVHALIFRLIAENKISGLRVDHIDGLRDPLEYLQRLQTARKLGEDEDSDALSIYTVIEKIISGAETLPPEWPSAGTTGYDFANAVNTLFVDAKGSRELEVIYRDFTGIHSFFTDTWYVRKKQVMEEIFESDIRSLSFRLGRLAAFDRLGRDIPMRELVRGLKEITARLGIYRTYYRGSELSKRDRRYLEEAIRIARDRTPPSVVSEPAFDFLKRIFLLEATPGLLDHNDERQDFIMRWQQFTGAVMAKGLEDTAFFVHHGLISLNEVGANPFRRHIRFGVNAFHQYNRRTLAEHPYTLNATSTHDTKWSEDVRARINVLSELPEEWKSQLTHWTELNRPKKTQVDGRVVPSPNEEILLYQSMLGVWPFEPLGRVDLPGLKERIETFMLKATREAKTHSNWISPNERHEAALRAFSSGILDLSPENTFLTEFSEFARMVAVYGAANGYSQALLKMTSPGVPDLYQGAELWRLSLTDPDNRRPVSFPKRVRFLEELKNMQVESAPEKFTELLDTWEDGRLKLWLTKCVLNFRRAHRELFLQGGYVPVEAGGQHRESVCSFARFAENDWALVAAPRLLTRVVGPGKFPVGDVWGDGTLKLPVRAPARWENLFTCEKLVATGGRRERALRLADVLSRLPFAVLVAEPLG